MRSHSAACETTENRFEKMHRDGGCSLFYSHHLPKEITYAFPSIPVISTWTAAKGHICKELFHI
jgi:hypothetical protein